MRIALLIASLAFFNSTARAEVVLPISNLTPEVVDVWIWSESSGDWLRPQLRLPPNSLKMAELQPVGQHYVVVRSAKTRRDWACGWFDFSRMLARSPSARFAINTRLFTVTKEVPITVMRMVEERRIRERKVWRRVTDENGVRWVPETVLEEYSVKFPVAEQQFRTVQIEQEGFNGNASDENGDLFSQVILKTATPGAVIRYKLAGRAGISSSRTTTTSTDKIPIGIYHLWAERGGRWTSHRFTHRIYDEEMTIEIPEHPVRPRE